MRLETLCAIDVLHKLALDELLEFLILLVLQCHHKVVEGVLVKLVCFLVVLFRVFIDGLVDDVDCFLWGTRVEMNERGVG